MQIVFVNSLSETDGVTVRCRTMVQCLKESGHEVFYCESHPTSFPEAEIIYPSGSLVEDGQAIQKRIEFIQSFPEADAIIVSRLNILTAPILIYCRYKRTPIILDWDIIESNLVDNAKTILSDRLIERSFPRYIPIITTPDESIFSYAKRRGARNVFTVPQSVNDTLFNPNRYERHRERKRLLISDETIAIALLLFLDKKNADLIELVFRTMMIVQQKKIPLRLIFIGCGDQQYNYIQKAKEMSLDNIMWTGREEHDRIPRLLAACDAGLALDPESKGRQYHISLSTLEYLFMGLPVINACDGSHNKILSQWYERIVPLSSEQLSEALESFYYEKTMSIAHSVHYSGNMRQELENRYGIRKMKLSLEKIVEKAKLLRYY